MNEGDRTNRPSSLLFDRKVLICVGAGGVGKTTLAAAIAVKAARMGKKVVCLTIDPARRLADSLGVSPADGIGNIKDITHLLGEANPTGQLSFGMLDPKKTFADIVKQRASSPEAADRILNNKLYRYISGSLSGMQEYMALEQLLTIRDDKDVELIVLDTPPAANAIDFFTAPSRMTEALDGRLVRIMRSAYRSPARTGFSIWGRWTSTLLRALSRFTGIELLNEIMAFVDALSDLFGSFAERAEAIQRVLHDGQIAFLLVTTADKSTLRETREFKDQLIALDIRMNAVVVNRVHWPRANDPPMDLDPKTRVEVLKINTEWNRVHEIEETHIRGIQKTWVGLDIVVRVPILPKDAVQIDSLDSIGQYI